MHFCGELWWDEFVSLSPRCLPAVIWTVGPAVTPTASPANWKSFWQQQQQQQQEEEAGHRLSSPPFYFPCVCLKNIPAPPLTSLSETCDFGPTLLCMCDNAREALKRFSWMQKVYTKKPFNGRAVVSCHCVDLSAALSRFHIQPEWSSTRKQMSQMASGEKTNKAFSRNFEMIQHLISTETLLLLQHLFLLFTKNHPANFLSEVKSSTILSAPCRPINLSSSSSPSSYWKTSLLSALPAGLQAGRRGDESLHPQTASAL